MITEKQVREWAARYISQSRGTAVFHGDTLELAVRKFIRDNGVLAEPLDKPLLAERFRQLVPNPFGEINELFREHQAALDAFAEAVRRIECGESVCFDGVCRRIREALAAARKAGLTKVGA